MKENKLQTYGIMNSYDLIPAQGSIFDGHQKKRNFKKQNFNIEETLTLTNPNIIIQG